MSKYYRVVWLIRRLFRDLARKSAEHTELEGISVSERAVAEFLYPDRVMSVPEIAERYGVSRQHVQVTVNELIADGYVRTRRNPQHKRSPLLCLNEHGKHMFERILRRDEAALKRLFHGVDREHLSATIKTLEHLREAVLQDSGKRS